MYHRNGHAVIVSKWKMTSVHPLWRICALIRILKKSSGNCHFINHLRTCLSVIYFLVNSQVHITPYKLNAFSDLSLCLAIFFARHWTWLSDPEASAFPFRAVLWRSSFHSTWPCLFPPTLKGFHNYLHKRYIPWSLARLFFPDVLLLCVWTTNFNMLISAFMA